MNNFTVYYNFVVTNITKGIHFPSRCSLKVCTNLILKTAFIFSRFYVSTKEDGHKFIYLLHVIYNLHTCTVYAN